MAEVISVASQKGGTGKTSSSISLASGLAKQGKKVLLVDMDSQANSSKVLIPEYQHFKVEDTIYATILEKEPIPVYETQVGNLDIAPSHILLSNTDVKLTTAIDHREARLKNRLDEVRDNYDYVFIDCPPALSWLTVNAFTASDDIIVVIAPGYFELDSIVQVNKSIQEVQENFNSALRLLGYLFTMSDPTVNAKTSLQVLRQTYTDDVFKTIIPRNTDLRDAHFQKQNIFDYNADSSSAQAYLELIKEIQGKLDFFNHAK